MSLNCEIVNQHENVRRSLRRFPLTEILFKVQRQIVKMIFASMQSLTELDIVQKNRLINQEESSHNLIPVELSQ